MRYRVRHLLATMAFVAIWLPLSRWLLALEAMDHPNKPQAVADFLGFYLGSATIAASPFIVFWAVSASRQRPGESIEEFASNPGRDQQTL